MSTQENPTAFPANCEAVAMNEQGMTLRDYFAAKAMHAMISTAASPCMGGLDGYEPHVSNAAYEIADAMLKARES